MLYLPKVNFQWDIAAGCLKASVTSAATLICLLSLLSGGAVLHGRTPASGVKQDGSATVSSGAATKAFSEGRDLIEAGRWEEAAASFTLFLNTFPRDRNTAQSLYWLAFALKKQGKLQEAEQSLERVSKEFGASEWADDARAMRIEIAGALGDGQVIEDALANGEDELKLIALQALLKTDETRALAYVNDLLKPDSVASQKLKEFALPLIGQHGGAQATKLLVDVIRNEQNLRLRKAALLAFGRTNDESVWSLLKELVSRDDDGELTYATLFAISRQGSPRARALLLELARTSTSKKVRNGALQWLAQEKSESNVEEIIKLYEAESNGEAQAQLLRVLAQFESPRAQNKLIEIARSSPSVELRKRALAFAGRAGERALSAETLGQLYDAEKNVEVKDIILFLLSVSKQEQGSKKLADVAQSDVSGEMRQRADFWLKHKDDRKASKFIKELIK
jgi:HEAT repeat protein